MNILFTYCTPFHPQRGGIGRVTDSLTREFIRRGHNVYYLIYPSLLHPFGMNDTEIFNFPASLFFTPSKILLSNINLNFYNNFLTENKIDVVINQSGSSEDAALWVKAENLNIPVISCIHSSILQRIKVLWQSEILPLKSDKLLEPFKRIIRIFLYPKIKRKNFLLEKNHYNWLIPQTSRLCLLSSNFYDDVYTLVNNDISSKLCCVPNPNSYPDIAINLKDKKKQLLYVGLFNSAKGTERLIKIWKKLYKKNPDWELIIVGAGNPDITGRIRRLSAKIPRIKFEGLKDNPLPYYKDASILCMTSNYEGWGMVLTEAQQCGTVPFAFKSFSSVTDIIKDNYSGILITPFDIDEYVAKLDILMNNHEERMKIAINAMESVKKFDIKIIADKWEEIFNSLCNEN